MCQYAEWPLSGYHFLLLIIYVIKNQERREEPEVPGNIMGEGRKKQMALQSEYHVVIQYGNEDLKVCIERMAETKKKRLELEACNSPKDLL